MQTLSKQEVKQILLSSDQDIQHLQHNKDFDIMIFDFDIKEGWVIIHNYKFIRLELSFSHSKLDYTFLHNGKHYKLDDFDYTNILFDL